MKEVFFYEYVGCMGEVRNAYKIFNKKTRREGSTWKT